MTKFHFAFAGLSIERLTTFCKVVDAGGISNAAPGNSNQQSQFSRQLKELEEFFGTELLRRRRGRFELTPAGRELFQIVQSHFTAIEDLAKRCSNQNIELAIGAGESLLNGLLIPNFAAFRLRHPTITPVLQNLRTEEITQRLIDGRLDIGLLRQDAVRAPLKSARLGSIQYGLVPPANVQKLTGDKAAWAILAQHPIALLADSEISAAIEAEAEKKNVTLTVCLRSSSYSQLAEAIRQIGCAAVLPTFATSMLEPKTKIAPFTVLKAFTRTTAIAWNPRSSALRPAFPSLIESLTLLLRQKLQTPADA